MNRMHSFDCFQLQHDLIGDNEIKSMNVKARTSIYDGERLFALKRNARGLEFDSDRTLVDLLEETRPEFAVHGDAAPDRSMD